MARRSVLYLEFDEVAGINLDQVTRYGGVALVRDTSLNGVTLRAPGRRFDEPTLCGRDQSAARGGFVRTFAKQFDAP